MDEKKSYLMFTEQGHFGYSECNFQLEKENIPKYTIMYLNQSQISYKGSKKIYYAEYFALGQILEHSDSPKILEDVVLGEREVFLICARYNINSGKFEGLYKCLGEIIVRGDEKEIFLDYELLKTQSKKLSSVQKRKIPNTFEGTLFNNFKYRYEAFAVNADKLNFFSLHNS